MVILTELETNLKMYMKATRQNKPVANEIIIIIPEFLISS